MLEHKTVLEQTEVIASGHIQLRFALLVVDGDKVISRALHRTVVEPGADIDAQIAAVNAHLTDMGRTKVTQEDIETPKRISEVVWTKKVLDDFNKKKGQF